MGVWKPEANNPDIYTGREGVMKMIEVARLYRTSNGYLKAFADVIINGLVLVKGIRVVSSRENGLFVAMPKQRGKDNRWYETVSLLDEEAKQELQEAVLEAFNA